MKKILLGLLVTGTVATVALVATNAFFSDTETSTGNTLQAGSIDLIIDNHSYIDQTGLGLVENAGTTWRATDLTNQLFFNFSDLKPGDLGEDTISLHVDSNPAWVCADIRLTANSDETCTEPENAAVDGENGACTPEVNGQNGDLAQALNFVFWKDDGDNVLEDGEQVLTQGPASGILNGAHWALFDSSTGGPTDPDQVYWIGKAWCFGALSEDRKTQDNLPNGPGNPSVGPDVRGAGVKCDGTLVNNVAQTDLLRADIVFRAVQQRHNDPYFCDGRQLTPTPTITPSVTPTPTEPQEPPTGPV